MNEMELKARCEVFDENYKRVLENMNKAAQASDRDMREITLLAATKTVEVEVLNHAYRQGIRYMGENRVQEFLQKNDALDKNVHRHFIGTLQTNKVKQIVGKVELIQSVDSLKLAKEIAKQSKAQGIVSDVLVEINIGNETSKSGILSEELDSFLGELSEIKEINVRGLMTLGPILTNAQKKLQYFDKMQKLFIDNKGKNMDNIHMDILSMGMSEDYMTAIQCGATLIRVGSALFGARNYNV